MRNVLYVTIDSLRQFTVISSLLFSLNGKTSWLSTGIAQLLIEMRLALVTSR